MVDDSLAVCLEKRKKKKKKKKIPVHVGSFTFGPSHFPV
jgi:hypothetical protein